MVRNARLGENFPAMMTIDREPPEVRLARLEAQNQRLMLLAETLVAKLVDHGVLSEQERQDLPGR